LKRGLSKNRWKSDHSLENRYIEDRSWWFKKVFTVESKDLQCDAAELVFDMLDSEADIFLNGFHLGHHRSAFRPLRREVNSILTEGENILMVRVTSGLEHYSEKDFARVKRFVAAAWDAGKGIYDRGDARRVFVESSSMYMAGVMFPGLPPAAFQGMLH
jgi:beta-mannosidase